ncbi:MAG: metalloprotease PmbA [Gammaproteobacteria bacterium]
MSDGDDSRTLERLVAHCLDVARVQGASACEAAASLEAGLSVGVRLGEVETVEYQRDRAIGVTVYFGQRKGSASTADFSDAALRDTVDAACRIARFTAEDEHIGLADPERLATEFPDLELDHPWAIDPPAAIALALRAEAAARGADARITNSDGAGFSSHRGTRCYANSHGFVGTTTGTHHSLSCAVIAGAGGAMQRDGWHTIARAESDMESAESVGRRAAERALRRLGARRIPTTRVPVLFAPEVARGLIGHLLAAIRGSAQYRQSSFLLDALGSQVMPAGVTVREEPLLARGPASTAFDGEGVATRAAELVSDGRLQTYLLDSYSARRLGRESTGHAGGWTNVLVAGDRDPATLLRGVERGFYVTELMGQGVNLVTGDYSRGATGFWVDGGELTHPVEEVTVAGNLRDMLLGIVGFGNDIDRRHPIQVGSILIDRMAVAGD